MKNWIKVALLTIALPASLASANPAAESLEQLLAEQPAEVQARYTARHPQEVLNFFGVEPGMTVLEALPGGGWFSRILVPYLGPDGVLIGADYSLEMYPLFGFFSEEQLKAKETWTTDWPGTAAAWVEEGAAVKAFNFGSMPAELAGTADVVLMIRAMHNLSRFEGEGGFMTQALADAHQVLKPGGIVGIVQHEAQPDTSDEGATGSRGYLKKADVIAAMDRAGFDLVAESDINQNPLDRPAPQEFVWRLPPTYIGSEPDSEQRAAVDAIGESNRMTLKFVKR